MKDPEIPKLFVKYIELVYVFDSNLFEFNFFKSRESFFYVQSVIVFCNVKN